jgi:hypothetical protein
MAPEVVDQSGATTASDIWSVGCVVIELLEGKPPYYFLDPMPALFRIVNDDCPPLPESASPIARDFLLQCFQKDQNLRISAKKLLKHPWMLSAKKRLEQKEREQALAQGRRTPGGHYNQNGRGNSSQEDSSQDNISKTGYDETVQRVQDWNKALESPTAIHPKPQHEPVHSPLQALAHLTTTSPNQIPSVTHRPNEDLQSLRPKTVNRNLFSNVGSIGPSKAGPAALSQYQDEATSLKNSTIRGLAGVNVSRSATNSTLPLSSSALPLAVISTTPPARKLAEMGIESPQGDNWDDDFEGGISTSKIAALDEAHANSGSSESEEDDDDDDSDESSQTRRLSNRDDNTATIKPSGTGIKSSTLSKSLQQASGLGAIVEDYSDLVGDDQRDPFEGKVASLKVSRFFPWVIFLSIHRLILSKIRFFKNPQVLNQHQKILHPKDISLPSSTITEANQGIKSRLSTVVRSDSPGGTHRSDSPVPTINRSQGATTTSSSSSSSSSGLSRVNSALSGPPPPPHSLQSHPIGDPANLNRFTEQAGEDYSDLFGKTLPPNEDDREFPSSSETLKLQTRLSNMSSKSWVSLSFLPSFFFPPLFLINSIHFFFGGGGMSIE